MTTLKPKPPILNPETEADHAKNIHRAVDALNLAIRNAYGDNVDATITATPVQPTPAARPMPILQVVTSRVIPPYGG
jgi:hypothetical protein